MSTLPGPYEFWDMEAGETRTVMVDRYEEGTVTIEPRYRGAPAKKVVPCMRLHLKQGFKPTLPYYWDLTSKLLIAGLRPHLERGDLSEKEFTIGKFGSGPGARFSLEVLTRGTPEVL